MKDAVASGEIGLTEYYDSEAAMFMPVKKGLLYYPAFRGMPQAWSWALHFCNSAVQYGVEVAAGPGHRLVVDRREPVQLSKQVAYSVYIDNALEVGASVVKPVDGLNRALQRLRDIGFSLHEETAGAVEIEIVGLVLCTKTGVWRHKRERVWELSYATKHFMGFGKAPAGLLRLFLGKFVHHFSFVVPGMSVFYDAYRALGQSPNHVLVHLTQAVRVVFRAALGLIVLAEAPLSVPEASEAYCGDATLNGYALQVTKVRAGEVQPLRREGRFVEVEEMETSPRLRHRSRPAARRAWREGRWGWTRSSRDG